MTTRTADPFTLALPRVVGTRPAVAPFVRDLPGDLRGAAVVLDCRTLLSGTASFADEMVHAVLVERRADELLALGAAGDFAADLSSSAREHGVLDRLHLR